MDSSWSAPHHLGISMNQKQALFSFQGRMRRKAYWLYSIPVLLLMIPVFFYQGGNALLDILSFGLLFLIMYMSAALNVKRLKDRNKSPIWLLVTFMPLIGPIFSLIELGILEGTKGPNRYGPDPKEQGGAGSKVTDLTETTSSKDKKSTTFEC